MQNLEVSVIRILNVRHRTVGTGFFVADRLAVTCAHVIHAAGSECGQAVSIRPYRSTSAEVPTTALILAEGWSPRQADDVAFLQVDAMPEGMRPVVLGAQGFPILKNEQKLVGKNRIG